VVEQAIHRFVWAKLRNNYLYHPLMCHHPRPDPGNLPCLPRSPVITFSNFASTPVIV